jgi:hypothetical protein
MPAEHAAQEHCFTYIHWLLQMPCRGSEAEQKKILHCAQEGT